MRLTKDQQKIAQWIFDRFQEDGSWPRLHDVERAMLLEVSGEVTDVVESVLHLPGKDGWGLPTDRSRRVRLPVAVMRKCHGVEDLLGVLMEALPVMLDVYLHGEGRPRIRHSDLQARGWSRKKTDQLAQLFWNIPTPFLGGGGGTPSQGTWDWEIQPSIERYAFVATARDLLDLLVEDEHASQQRWKRKNGWPSREVEANPSLPRGFRQWVSWVVASAVVAVIAIVVAWWLLPP